MTVSLIKLRIFITKPIWSGRPWRVENNPGGSKFTFFHLVGATLLSSSLALHSISSLVLTSTCSFSYSFGSDVEVHQGAGRGQICNRSTVGLEQSLK